MPLPEHRKAQLDTIVSRMISNGESDANIQEVVNDFKSLHGSYGHQSKSPQKQFKPGKLSAFTSGVARGATMGLSDVASNVAAAGINTLRGRGGFGGNYKRAQEITERQKKASPIISTIGEIGGFVNPASVGSTLLNIGTKGAKKAIGKKALSKIADVTGKKTLGGLAARTTAGTARRAGEGALFSTAEQAINEQKISPDRLKGDMIGSVALGAIGKGLGVIGTGGKRAAKKFMHKQHWMPGDKLSQKIIESNVLRGTKTSDKLDRGFANFNKHDLWGDSFEEILQKTGKKIKDNATKLDESILKTKSSITLDDMQEVYTNTAKSIANNTKLNNQYGFKKVQGLLDNIQEDILETAVRNPKGNAIQPRAIVDIKRGADSNINYNVAPDQNVMLKSEVYHEYRKHLDKMLSGKIGKAYREANKNLSELIPIQHRVDKNYTQQRQNLELDNETFGPVTLLKTIFTGESPRRDISVANKVRGADPYLLQLKNIGSTIDRTKVKAPRTGAYATHRTLRDLFY